MPMCSQGHVLAQPQAGTPAALLAQVSMTPYITDSSAVTSAHEATDWCHRGARYAACKQPWVSTATFQMAPLWARPKSKHLLPASIDQHAAKPHDEHRICHPQEGCTCCMLAPVCEGRGSATFHLASICHTKSYAPAADRHGSARRHASV